MSSINRIQKTFHISEEMLNVETGYSDNPGMVTANSL